MSKQLGEKAEEFVKNYLIGQGYKIKDQNVRFAFGEIDLVALDRNVLVFIEVKYRKSNLYYLPFEAVTRSKQQKIIKAAMAYLQKMPIIPYCRFDVISICKELNHSNIEHIKDAFTLS